MGLHHTQNMLHIQLNSTDRVAMHPQALVLGSPHKYEAANSPIRRDTLANVRGGGTRREATGREW